MNGYLVRQIGGQRERKCRGIAPTGLGRILAVLCNDGAEMFTRGQTLGLLAEKIACLCGAFTPAKRILPTGYERQNGDQNGKKQAQSNGMPAANRSAMSVFLPSTGRFWRHLRCLLLRSRNSACDSPPTPQGQPR